MAVVATVAGGPFAEGGGSSAGVVAIDPDIESYMGAAVTTLGLTRYVPWHDDFLSYKAQAGGFYWVPNATSGSAVASTANVKGGWVKIQTAAGANTNYQAWYPTIGRPVSNVRTTKWWFGWKGALTSIGDAETFLGMGFLNAAGNKTIAAGFCGALSATNYVVQFDGIWTGTALDLGVALDTNVHVFEMRSDGANGIFGRIDGGSWVSGTQTASAPADGCIPYLGIRNGAAGGSRTGEIDWAAMIVEASP